MQKAIRRLMSGIKYFKYHIVLEGNKMTTETIRIYKELYAIVKEIHLSNVGIEYDYQFVDCIMEKYNAVCNDEVFVFLIKRAVKHVKNVLQLSIWRNETSTFY